MCQILVRDRNAKTRLLQRRRPRLAAYLALPVGGGCEVRVQFASYRWPDAVSDGDIDRALADPFHDLGRAWSEMLTFGDGSSSATGGPAPAIDVRGELEFAAAAFQVGAEDVERACQGGLAMVAPRLLCLCGKSAPTAEVLVRTVMRQLCPPPQSAAASCPTHRRRGSNRGRRRR